AAGLASAATDVLILQNPTSLVSDARYIDYAGPWAPALPAQTDRPVYNAIDRLPDWYVQQIDQQYGELFGQEAAGRRWYTGGELLLDDLIAVQNFAVASTTAAGEATNVQVAGVDEADLVESDGEYLYLVADGKLSILDLRGEQPAIVAQVQLDGRAIGMYLFNNRLTIVEEAASPYAPEWEGVSFRYSAMSSAAGTTTVTVLDVADRAAPKLVERTELDGRMIASRMVDGELRLVLDASGASSIALPDIQLVAGEIDPETGARQYAYESRDAYLSRALQVVRETRLAGYRQLDGAGGVVNETPLVTLNEALHDGVEYRGRPRTIVATFDTTDAATGPTDLKTIKRFQATTVYSTNDSLYVAGNSVGDNGRWYDGATLTIHKFDVDNESHELRRAATGHVDGSLINQFALDEYEGRLRVVTEQWGEQSLFVLEQHGARLKVVGTIANLAPGERLYAVRFMGDRAFAVTFRKVDPLFAIDLSDPTNPTVAGELKIPGYSEYLQPIGENFVLAIGRGALEDRGLFQELQASIFDVSDLSDPQLAHRYSFAGNRATASIATGDRWAIGDVEHHAIGYFAEAGLLAIPVHSEGGGSSEYGAIGGLQVLRINATTGFEEAAFIEHDARILRSLQVGDRLAVVSSGEVSIYSLADPSVELGRVDLADGIAVALAELQRFVPFSSQELASLASAVASAQGASTRVDAPLAPEFATSGPQAPVSAPAPASLAKLARRYAAIDEMFDSAEADESTAPGDAAPTLEVDWLQFD
ncbi:MAG: beta-propeller domain-containing protein, partial [Planctomycetales bacterium]|nr:beta-propeller domain-containing protein [Planctomycetales bacterium]